MADQELETRTIEIDRNSEFARGLLAGVLFQERMETEKPLPEIAPDNDPVLLDAYYRRDFCRRIRSALVGTDQRTVALPMNVRDVDVHNSFYISAINSPDPHLGFGMSEKTHAKIISMHSGNKKTCAEQLRTLNLAWIASGGTPRPAFVEFQASTGTDTNFTSPRR